MSVFVIGSINSALFEFEKEPAWECCGANKEAAVDLISFPTFQQFNKCRSVYIKVPALENVLKDVVPEENFIVITNFRHPI